ncbi:MAG: hypothetical protein RIR69_1459, partial [Actinomycetota bacterium]
MRLGQILRSAAVAALTATALVAGPTTSVHAADDVETSDAVFEAKLVALGYDNAVDGKVAQASLRQITNLDLSN